MCKQRERERERERGGGGGKEKKKRKRLKEGMSTVLHIPGHILISQNLQDTVGENNPIN